jgi:ankyrin repeat protein
MKKLLKYFAIAISVPIGLLLSFAILHGLMDYQVHESTKRQTRAQNLAEAVCRTDQYTPASVEMVSAFINQGGDVNERVADFWGNPIALIARAAECGHKDIFRLLVQHGASVNEAGLHELVIAGREDMARWLIDQGATLEPQTPQNNPEVGRELLQAAAFGGQTWLVQRLLDKGADIHMVNARGDSLLVIALNGAYGGKLETVKLLLAAGISPNSVGASDIPPLILAAFHTRKDEVELLLGAGAKVDAPAPPSWFEKAPKFWFEKRHVDFGPAQGTTALFFAVANCDIELVEILARHGASKSAAVSYYDIPHTKTVCKSGNQNLEKLEKLRALLAE